MSRRTQAYWALTLVSLIWGIGAVVIKYTLQFIEPFSFLTYRFWLSFLVVLPFFFFEYRKHNPKFKDLLEIGGLTLVGVPVGLILLFLGINLTSALEASFILVLAPIFTVLAGWWFLKEKIETHEAIGLGVASLGTSIIILEPILRNQSFSLTSLTGNLLLLLTVIIRAYYTVRSRRDLQHRFSPWFITIIGFLIAPFFLTPLSIQEQSLADFPALILNLPISAHLGVWYMAIVSGVVAYFLFQFGLKRIEASEATIFQYLNPLFGAPLAVLWLGDEVTAPFIIGAVITAVGVLVSEYRPRKSKR